MKCAKCDAEYSMSPGDNQHTECPRCGAPAGDMKGRDLIAQHAEAVHRFTTYWEATVKQRQKARRRRNFYDGRQWTPADLAVYKARKQPPVVFNLLAKKIDYLNGIEIETRTDPKPRPRTPMHADDVQAYEDGLRYACDAARVNKVFSKGWDEKLVEGVCGAVIEHEVVGKGDAQDIKILVRYVHHDRAYADPYSREPDYSDALFKGCFAYMDTAEAKAFYRGRADKAENFEQQIDNALAKAGESGSKSGDDGAAERLDWADPRRNRVLVCEEYYQEADEDGQLCQYTRHFTSAGFLVPPKKTGYLDDNGVNVCPLELDSGFVDGDGDTHERYGLSERMMWPQEAFNKHRSRALHAANTPQVRAEEGAIPDIDKYKEEAAKPGGVMIVNRGAIERVRDSIPSEIAQSNADFAQDAKQAIHQIGPDDAMISTAGASSGRERQIMKSSGMTELAKLTDQHRDWKRRVITQVGWRMRQLWTYEMWRRVQDDTEETGYRFVGLNRRMTKAQRLTEMLQHGATPEAALSAIHAPADIMERATQEITAMVQQDPAAAQQMQANPQMLEQLALKRLLSMPEMQQAFVAADIARMDMDIVIDEAPDVSVVQQEEAEEIAKVGQSMIAAGQPYPIELQIEASSLRQDKKKRMMAVIEKSQKPNPQVAQLQQQMQQIQASMAEMQLRLTHAEVQKTQSETELNQAKTASTAADGQLKTAQAMRHAAEAGARVGGGATSTPSPRAGPA